MDLNLISVGRSGESNPLHIKKSPEASIWYFCPKSVYKCQHVVNNNM